MDSKQEKENRLENAILKNGFFNIFGFSSEAALMILFKLDIRKPFPISDLLRGKR